MDHAISSFRYKLSVSRANLLLILLFLTGCLLGSVFVRVFSPELLRSIGILHGADCLSGFSGSGFVPVLLTISKFLLVICFLSGVRWGAMLIPPVFGFEGMMLSASASCFLSSYGKHGIVMYLILMAFRLILVLPYGFLLGFWSIERSLNFGAYQRNFFGVFLLTVLVILISAFLECTISKWLFGMYYLQNGV